LNDAPSVALLVCAALSAGDYRLLVRHGIAMLSVNRYRVKHRAQQGQKTAKVLEGLLQKPDDWLGANLVILAAASVFASSIATILAQRTGLLLRNTDHRVRSDRRGHRLLRAHPKIYAATLSRGGRPERGTDLPRAGADSPSGSVADEQTRLRSVEGVRCCRNSRASQSLNTEELRTVVAECGSHDSGASPAMLLSILDLGQVTVNDIMIPRRRSRRPLSAALGVQ